MLRRLITWRSMKRDAPQWGLNLKPERSRRYGRSLPHSQKYKNEEEKEKERKQWGGGGGRGGAEPRRAAEIRGRRSGGGRHV